MSGVEADVTRPVANASPIAALLKPNVLLVDDQPARLLTYETLLEGLGVTCVRALSGEEALRQLLKQSFALILLDVSMPGIDGFETARLIRDHPRFERTPIIFVTGVHVSDFDTLRGYEVGAIDYISVPIIPEILRSKVALLVELYRRRTELETLNRTLEATRAQLEVERHTQQQANDARYRAIFENPMALTVVLRAVRSETGEVIDWEYLDANRNALRLVDLSPEEVIGQRLSVIFPERLSRLMPLGAKVLADGVPLRYEMSTAGTEFTMCLFPMGEDILVSSGFDITARVHAEQKTQRDSEHHRAENEWLSAVLDSMNEEVYFTNTEQQYTYANPAAIREFGHERVKGVPVSELVARIEVLRPDGTPRPLEEAPPLRALKGEVIRGEEQLVRTPRTGQLRHRRVSSAPVRGPDGRILGAVSVVWDVTEQRRADAELRTRAKELREADRRKDELIAMLAHELRNPLVPIRTAAELLKKAQEHPSLIARIQPMLERQVTHMVRLVDDLLDVSRFTSGKIDLKREVVSVAALVDGVVEANRDAIAAANLEIAVRLAEPRLTVSVDPTRFSQILSNLVQNAIKFTSAGKITISSAVEQGDDATGRRLCISVADTGIGISQAVLPHIFELFAQADSAGRGRQSGLGIGLALGRHLAEMHGGSLEAFSAGPDQGSEFFLRIPLAGPIPEPQQRPDVVGTRRLEGIRVMVVDDTSDVADILGMLIEQQGGLVRVAYDGASAIKAAREFQPNAVVLDIGMPELDGYEVCRRLRADFGSEIRIIALTGWGQQQDKCRALESGFDAHLTKPADPEQLAATIGGLKN